MRKPAEWLRLLAVGAVLLGLLYAGLSPNGSAVRNEVAWSRQGAGLRFAGGIAFSDGPLYWRASEQPRELTIEAWVVAHEPLRGPRTLLALADGARVALLEIAADRASTALRYRVPGWLGRPAPRAVSLERGLPERSLVHLAVTSGTHGTRLYVDGSAPDVLRLRQPLLPAGPGFAARLVLGNTAQGGAGWAGEFHGLAVFDRVLEEPELRAHDRRFRAGGAREFAAEPWLRALYAFDEPGGREVVNLASAPSALQIPRRVYALHWGVLELPVPGGGWSSRALADALRNLLGFLPFGALLASAVRVLGARSRRRAWALACAGSALVSLGIELGQALLPLRHSSALDLLLNTVGGGIGAALWCALAPLRRLLSPRAAGAASACRGAAG